MAPQPTLNTKIYDAISPKNFLGQFKDKLVVVTGAGRGIGRHIALSFARAGATLALLDFDTVRQQETKSLCEKEDSKVYTYGCDVTQYEQCKQVVKEIEQLGEIDVLVNNAGGGPIRGFTSQKFEEFWAGVEQNLKGVCQSTNGRELIIDCGHDTSRSTRNEGTQRGLYYQHCFAVRFRANSVDK